MEAIERIPESTPRRAVVDRSALQSCVDACTACAIACSACARACAGELDSDGLSKHLELNQDCTDICHTTARLLSRQLHSFKFLRSQLETCALACAACGIECRVHADQERCRIAAAACQRCEDACRKALRSLRASA